VIPDVPFSSLLTPKQTSPPPISLVEPNTKTTMAAITCDSNNGNNERLNNDNMTSKCASQNGSRRSSCSMTSANDDFIMVDLVIDALNPNDILIIYYILQCEICLISRNNISPSCKEIFCFYLLKLFNLSLINFKFKGYEEKIYIYIEYLKHKKINFYLQIMLLLYNNGTSKES